MYQAYLDELSQAHHSEQPTKAHHGVRQRFAGDLANLFRMALDDKSGDPRAEIARHRIAADFQLYTSQLTALGPEDASRLVRENESLIKSLCKPNFVDPYWLVSLHDLGLPELVTYLADFCELRSNHDSGLFDDIQAISISARRKLARAGMETIHQGYTYEFLDFAAAVALEAGVAGAQFRRFMSVGMDKTRDHFARALIKAIATQHASLPEAQVKYAVDSVWKFTEDKSSPTGFESAFKAELTSFFRAQDVPARVYAHSPVERDRLIGMDLGL